jgi:hypothetical protein
VIADLVTVTAWDVPVTELDLVSVAVMVCRPEVMSVMANDACPPATTVSAGKDAPLSVLVKWIVLP